MHLHFFSLARAQMGSRIDFFIPPFVLTFDHTKNREIEREEKERRRAAVWLWIDASLLSVWDIKKFKIIIIKCTFNDVLCRYEHASCMEIYNWKNDLYMTGNIIVLCGGWAVLRKKKLKIILFQFPLAHPLPRLWCDRISEESCKW